jgi:hypothetical protein
MDTYATNSNPIRIYTFINVNPTASVSAHPPPSSPHIIEDFDDEVEKTKMMPILGCIFLFQEYHF